MWGQRKLPLAPCNLHQPNPTQPNPGLGCFFFSAEIFCRISTEIHWIAYFYEHHNQHELRRGVGWEGEGGEGGGGGGKVMVSELHVSFSSSLRNSPPHPILVICDFSDRSSFLIYFILFYSILLPQQLFPIPPHLMITESCCAKPQCHLSILYEPMN